MIDTAEQITIDERDNLIQIEEKKRPYKIEKLVKVFNNQDLDFKKMRAVLDLYISTASDKELFDFVTELNPSHGREYSEVRRDWMLGIIDSLQSMTIAQITDALIKQLYNDSFDIGVISKNDEILCIFKVLEDEKRYSAYIQLAFRGTQKQRLYCAIEFLRFWKKSYQKYLYDSGFRFILANSFIPKGKEFIKTAGKSEPLGVFRVKQGNRVTRFNNKYHWSIEACWNLKHKFKEIKK